MTGREDHSLSENNFGQKKLEVMKKIIIEIVAEATRVVKNSRVLDSFIGFS